jgi:hypothetical protein
MIEIRPQVTKQQANLLKEVTTEIEEALQQKAEHNLCLQRGMLNKDADKKLRSCKASLKRNVDVLQADLRKEAELVELKLRESFQDPLNQEASATQPQTQLSTPEPKNPQTTKRTAVPITGANNQHKSVHTKKSKHPWTVHGT